MPVPVKAIVDGELEALLGTVRLPVRVPAAAGLKVAVTVAVCPGDKISPEAPPLALKPAPAKS
jgi:hypothetical protein